MATISVSVLKQTYQNCLIDAHKWFKDQGHQFEASIINFDYSSDPLIIEIVLHFRPLPHRLSPKGKISILASSRDEICKNDLSCKKSNIHLTYFEIDDQNEIAHAIESIHYDAEVPPKEKHPICHGQIVNKSVSNTRRPESFHYAIEEENLKNRFQSFRIPSAYINLPGLLFILAADHLPNNKWKEFLEDCQPKFNNFPKLSGCNILRDISANASLMAHHWYDRDPNKVTIPA